MNWVLLLACFVGFISCQNASIAKNHNLQNKFFFEWINSIFHPTTPAIRPKCPECSCGEAKKVKRIVGGQETEVNVYIWMASLTYDGKNFCGGSLLNDLYVLTAGHCVVAYKNFMVKLGLHNLYHNMHTITRSVAATKIHDHYNPFTFDNDLALVKMSQRIDLDPYSAYSNIGPVCLPGKPRDYEGKKAIVTGWGRTSEDGETPSVLLEVTVPIVSKEECQKGYEPDHKITASMLCAGLEEGGKDACQGDSGGPMQFHEGNNSQFTLIGVVSWGIGCARPNKYGVYTNVSRFSDWLDKHMPDACACTSTKNIIL